MYLITSISLMNKFIESINMFIGRMNFSFDLFKCYIKL